MSGHTEDAACRSLGITLEDLGPGRARLRMRITDDMVNLHGVAHGGYVFLLADAAFAYACNSRGPVTVAHSAQVTFVRPAAPERTCWPRRRSGCATAGTASTTSPCAVPAARSSPSSAARASPSPAGRREGQVA